MSDRKNIEYEIFEKLENATTKIAQKVYDVLNREGIDYDENGEIFDNFPEIIKDALNYLCEIGEID